MPIASNVSQVTPLNTKSMPTPVTRKHEEALKSMKVALSVQALTEAALVRLLFLHFILMNSVLPGYALAAHEEKQQ